MKPFYLWLEQLLKDDVKTVVISALFPELDEEDAENSLEMPLNSFDESKINELLASQEVQERLAGRDPYQEIERGMSIRSFIDWLSEPNNPMGISDENI
jgi:hypothetical protein